MYFAFRGVKATLWEGGTRGAGFVWSPLLQKRRYVSNHMMHVTDFLPTLLSVAGLDFLQTINEFIARKTTDNLENHHFGPK